MSKPKTTVIKKELTQDILKKHLEMNSKGDLIWTHDTPKAKKGNVAGTVREKDGYHSIVLLGVNYSGKQLKHFYETGSWATFFRKKPQVTVAIKEKGKAKVVKTEVKPKPKVETKSKAKVKKPIAQQIAEMEQAKSANLKFYDNNNFWDDKEE
jgi:hypothetical protein